MASFRRIARRVAGAGVAVTGAMVGGPVGGAVGGAIGGRIAGVDPGRAAALTAVGSILAPAALAGGSALLAGGGISGAAGAAGSSLTTQTLLGSFGGPSAASLMPSVFGAGAPTMPSEGPMTFSSFGPSGTLTPVAAAATAAGPSAGIVQLSGAMPQQIGGFAMATPVMGAMPAVGGAIAGGARMIGSAIVGATGRILGLVTSMGTRISVPKAARLARSFGLQITATLLGVGAVELAQAVMQDAVKKRGRGRGISAREIRTTSRTIGKLNRLHARISEIARAGGSRRRSTGRGAVHVRTAPVAHL